jgi:mRNA-degrading endonuclease toxin of MazEF toxin-antitoxin module
VGSGAPSRRTEEVTKVTRGTLVWVNMEDADPPEMGKTRPAVVLSNSEQNAVLGTVVVVPTSSRAPEIWPLRLELPAVGKHRKSYAIVPGIRQVDKRRLVGTVGRLPARSVDELARAVSAYLSD